MRLNRLTLHFAAVLLLMQAASRFRREHQRRLDQRSRSIRAALGDQGSQAL